MRPTCTISGRSVNHITITAWHIALSRGARWLTLLAGSLFCLVSQARADLDPTQPISQYVHQVWQDDQGLPENDVRAITPTRDGYLWIGTEEGLARFDGVHFVVFDSRNTPEFKNSFVTALFEDRDGTLWIGTLGGLFRMRRGTIAAYPVPEGFAGRIVTAFYQDAEGALWIATDGGGAGRLLNGKLTVYTTKDGLARNSVFAIGGSHDGSVWLGTRGGLNRWKNGQFTTYTTANGLPNNDVRAICEDPQGGLWIGTGAGLSLFKDGMFRPADRKSALSTAIVQTLYEDRDGTLWIGTLAGGMFRLQDGRTDAYSKRDGLSGDDVRAISRDEEGNLWVGTGDGLNRFTRARVSTYTTKDGLPSDVIITTYQDRSGDLWIGTNDHGLSRLHDGKFTNYSTKDGLSSDSVYSIVEDFDRNLWIGTRKGLDRFKDGRFKSYTTKDGLAGAYITATFVDRSGTLWVGGLGGLTRFKDGRFTVFPATEGLLNFPITAILEDRTGGLWIGNDTGISRLRNGRFESINIRNSGLSDDHVLSLYEDPQGALWIGTSGGGLDRLKDGKFTVYTTRQGMFDDIVIEILDPGDGNFWMSSNRGISYVSKQQLNDFADGKIQSVSYGLLGTEDGMKSRECDGGVQPAGWLTRDGQMLFPTVKGVAIVDPKRVKIDPFIPPTILESVTIDNQPVPVDATAVSPPGRGDLEFHFTAPSFAKPQKLRFEYRLEGYDRDWVDVIGARAAHYTNIPPGSYRFRVRTSQDGGSWNSEAVAFNFVLKPHYYRTYWFYILCALAAVALAAAVMRVRLLRLRVRQEELSFLVAQRTAELQSEILIRKRTEEDLAGARDEAIRARDELHFQANHDALTGLWNRRAILDSLDREMERSRRSRDPIGLLMLDVDHFKNINDSLGHPVGDVVLKEVADRIARTIRSYDCVGRYGGEEFLVVLPDCDEGQILQGAERIRAAIAEEVFSVGGSNIAVTISIGATVLESGTVSTMEILSIADAALYEAKIRGRNRTAFATHRSPAAVSPDTEIEKRLTIK